MVGGVEFNAINNGTNLRIQVNVNTYKKMTIY
jgi:hypothetical protein